VFFFHKELIPILNESYREYTFMEKLVEKMEKQIPLSTTHVCQRHNEHYAKYFMIRENRIRKKFNEPVDYKLLGKTGLYPYVSTWELLH